MATKKLKKQSSAGKSIKGKKKDKKGSNSSSSKKKKGDNMSAKKKKDMDELGMQLLQHALRSLREDYQSNCKHFITEPIPSLTKSIDRACSSVEHVDKIIINSTRLAFNDVYAITRTFMRYYDLNFICLWMAKMDVKGVDALAKFFAVNPSVSTLHILDCGLTPEAAPFLANLCRDAKRLKQLVLDHNPIGSKGASQIFVGTRENKHPEGGIQKMSLRYCDADSECAENLANMLVGNNVLLELDLTGNAIGDIGLFHLSKALRENQILEVLSLAANGISEKDSLSPFNIHLLNTHLNMDAGFPQYVAGGGGLGSDRSSNINNSSSYSSSSDSSPSPTQSQTLDSSINSEQQQQQQLLQQEGEGGGGENRNQSVPSSAVRTQRQLQQQQYQEEQLQQTFPGLLAFCISLASKNLGLSVLDLRGNHFGNLASKQILEMMAARKSACNSKRAAPLIVHITERIAGDVFDRILDFNDVMGDLSKKMFKKKK